MSGFCHVHGSVLTISDWSLSSLGGSPESFRILMTQWLEITYKRAVIMTPFTKYFLWENYRYGNHDGCAEIISRSVLSIGCLKFRTRWLLWRSRAIFEYKNGHLQRKFIKWILWNAINKINLFKICISVNERVFDKYLQKINHYKIKMRTIQQSKWIHFNTKVIILRNKFLKIFITVLILQLKYSRRNYQVSTALTFCLTAVCLTIYWIIHDCNIRSFQNIDPSFNFYDRAHAYSCHPRK